MENNSQKLFGPWFILLVIAVLGLTFFKTVILNDFEIINTEQEATTTEEVNSEEASTTESVTEPALDNIDRTTTKSGEVNVK
jgi:hypothetical protein